MRAITCLVMIWSAVLCSGGSILSCAQSDQSVEQNHPKSKVVEFDANHWYLADKSQFISYDGRKALAGTAYLKDVSFLNGTIEVDIWITGATGFAGFIFRVQSFDDYEWCWLRTHKTDGLAADGLQYAPAFKGATCWQFNGGPGGIGAVNVPKNQWVHMKLEFHDESATLYVKDMTNPVFTMDRLQLGLKKGSVGLQTFLRPGVQTYANEGIYFSNFAYQIDETSKPVTPKEKIVPPEVLAKWKLTPHYQIPDFDAVGIYPTDQLGQIKSWITPEVDGAGLVNITKYYGRPGGLGVGAKPDCAILRTYIESEQDQRIKMNFGYSDAAGIFLNQVPLFWGNSAFLSRNMTYGGWISFNDAVFLDLKKGRNELLVVVAEVFGGWGFQARLGDVRGVRVVE